jgi:hypothetical protein
LARLGVGPNGDLLFADSGATEGVRWQGQEVAGKNKIINGNMMVAQRATSFTSTGSANNDDEYTLDRWYILSDGNDAIDVTQATDVPTGGLNSIGLDVETVNKKFGVAQIIEQKNCIGLIGETVTLSFWAKVSSTTKLDNVKAGVVAWSGTADTVTSDIISAWGAEGTNPTLIANATYENSPANLGVTTSWARYTITAPVDTASTKNIIVFIWSDVTDTTLGDFLYVTDVQLEFGSVATRFTMHAGGSQGELAACQRYYVRFKSDGFTRFAYLLSRGSNAQDGPVILPVPLRAFASSVGFSTLLISTFAGGSTSAISTIALDASSESVIMPTINTTTTGNIGSGGACVEMIANNSSSAFLDFNAEL